MKKKHCMPSLDYQLTGVLLQHSFKWLAFVHNRNVCPVGEDQSTMRVQTEEDHARKNEQASLAVKNGSKTWAIPKSACHGCYCFQLDCKGIINGKGCFLCEQYAEAGEPAVKGASEWCLWDCPICKGRCKCTFEEGTRFTIHSSLKQIARQESKTKQAIQRKEIWMPQKMSFMGAWNITGIWPSSVKRPQQEMQLINIL
jgi:hypothetical protein